ncbi:hypothetical protein COOONC_08566 [Cooperia oncophora]
MEPHTSLQGWQAHVFGNFVHTAICMTIKFAVGGPFSLLSLALRGQNPVWKYLESKDHIPAKNRAEAINTPRIVVDSNGPDYRDALPPSAGEVRPPSRSPWFVVAQKW